MAYAAGNKALAICDRCGMQYRYLDLKEEWQGLKTCPSCWEEKHPQLGPFKVPPEPQALYKPRPDIQQPQTVPVGQNHVFPPWQNGPLQLITVVGTVRVVT